MWVLDAIVMHGGLDWGSPFAAVALALLAAGDDRDGEGGGGAEHPSMSLLVSRPTVLASMLTLLDAAVAGKPFACIEAPPPLPPSGSTAAPSTPTASTRSPPPSSALLAGLPPSLVRRALPSLGEGEDVSPSALPTSSPVIPASAATSAGISTLVLAPASDGADAGAPPEPSVESGGLLAEEGSAVVGGSTLAGGSTASVAVPTEFDRAVAAAEAEHEAALVVHEALVASDAKAYALALAEAKLRDRGVATRNSGQRFKPSAWKVKRHPLPGTKGKLHASTSTPNTLMRHMEFGSCHAFGCTPH